MKGQDRKAALAAYKERKTIAGIYAVRCLPSGECWVGGAPDLTTIQNRLWFTLRQGASLQRSLQAAWQTHGAEAFAFEAVERFAEDKDESDLAYVRDRRLKERVVHWVETLGATAL